MCEAFTLDGFDGTWHRVVRSVIYDGMLMRLVKAGVMSDRQARDFLDAGDGEFNVINPTTMATETYATIWDGPRVTMYRKVS